MLHDIIKERRRKLDDLRASGVDPYPSRTGRTFKVSEILENFGKLSKSKKKVIIAGRILGLRDQGNLIFLDVADQSGKLQCILKKDSLGNFKILKKNLDIGDFIEVHGILLKTKKGEKSLEAKSASVIVKSLKPVPSEWYGLKDAEEIYRKRYLDLLLNPGARDLFIKKSLFWDSLRNYLTNEGFLEVETPVLEMSPGGAEAEPFKTHMNALDQDFFLRISLELPLKKLLVGGYEKVFEIGRIFRNEGIDREHLQDYTQLEFYMAYRDYNDLMDFVENMYKTVIKKVCGSLKTVYDGKKIDWSKKWPKIKYTEVFKKANKIDPSEASLDELRRKAAELKIQFEPNAGKGRLIDLIFKKTVRPSLVQPCFLIDPPIEIEPLAKRSSKNRKIVERAQVIACGTELGKGFSELNDPLDQRARFEEQMKLREAGDKEAQRLDEDYLEAMEYGMPPAAGFGVSERLFAVLMDKPVRETVIFPLMRPKE